MAETLALGADQFGGSGSIDTFDRLWWLSDQYIAALGDPSDNQPQKYAKAGRRFLAGEPMWMPEVGLDADGSLTFRDGRHHYLWMREHGAISMPVAVEMSEAKISCGRCAGRTDSRRGSSRPGQRSRLR